MPFKIDPLCNKDKISNVDQNKISNVDQNKISNVDQNKILSDYQNIIKDIIDNQHKFHEAKK